jgi:cobalamin transport system ATP-binding protein
MTDLRLRGLSVTLDGVTVLDAVDLDVPTGSWTGLIGPNGAGKTTLVRAVAGLQPAGGEIAIGGVPLPDMNRRSLAREIAYVPQRPTIPEGISIVDYVLLGRTPHISYLGVEGGRDHRVVRTVMDRLELTALAERSLGSLSGGELQRAVLARALAQEASVLLFDEPTSALDVGHQQTVLELVDLLRVERGLTVLTAMHDLSLAGQFAERLVLLSGGRAVSVGPPERVLTPAAIRSHYGADVRVVTEDGRVLVIPVREAREVRDVRHPDDSGIPARQGIDR